MRHLNTHQAAVFLNRHFGTLQNWRSDGFGPPYVNTIGADGKAHTHYPLEGLEAFRSARAAGLTLAEASEVARVLIEPSAPLFQDDQIVHWTREDGVQMRGPFAAVKAEIERAGGVVPSKAVAEQIAVPSGA